MKNVISQNAVQFTDEEVLEHECTSWMVFGDYTKNNTVILHKNRDSKTRDVTILRSPENAKRKWIALGSKDAGREAPCMGMNSSGLAGVMNSGQKTPDLPADPNAKGTPDMLKVILEECDTASQALEYLLDLIKKEDYYHGDKGSTFFLADTKEGYICEFTAHFTSVQKYDKCYALRANIWHNPYISSVTEDPFPAYLNSCGREFMGIRMLNAAYRDKGCITRQDCLELARCPVMPEESPLAHRSVCDKNTNSVATFVLDQEFPRLLSTGYFTVGHPRHTVCIPVPIGITDLPEKMRQNVHSWSKASYDRLNELGFGTPLPEEWSAFENSSGIQYDEALALARKKAKEGRADEAVTILNDAASAIWKEAEALLKL